MNSTEEQPPFFPSLFGLTCKIQKLFPVSHAELSHLHPCCHWDLSFRLKALIKILFPAKTVSPFQGNLGEYNFLPLFQTLQQFFQFIILPGVETKPCCFCLLIHMPGWYHLPVCQAGPRDFSVGAASIVLGSCCCGMRICRCPGYCCPRVVVVLLSLCILCACAPLETHCFHCHACPWPTSNLQAHLLCGSRSLTSSRSC